MRLAGTYQTSNRKSFLKEINARNKIPYFVQRVGAVISGERRLLRRFRSFCFLGVALKASKLNKSVNSRVKNS